MSTVRLEPTGRIGDSKLAARLRRDCRGEILFDAFSRARYATDASIYQIEPLGVLVAKDADDVTAALAIAREEGVPVLARGGGTSQCGQTVGECLVIDTARHMNRLLDVDAASATALVEPGIVLDDLNRRLKPAGLWFPVDVSTANRATIGGMAGNNSCGSRSIRYGNMVHNVNAIDAVLMDGTGATFGELRPNLEGLEGNPRYIELVQQMTALAAREADEIDARFPKLLRRVGGYNIDMIPPHGTNMAHLLVGSEGTLGFFNRLELKLSEIPPHKTLGVCHFPTLHDAMVAVPKLVALGPTAVELADRHLIGLARQNDAFRSIIESFVQGDPAALLLVEFAGPDAEDNLQRLKRLVELMADIGFPGAVVEAVDAGFQSRIWEVRKQGLNIVMSMKGDGKPVSFVEDCAVPLADLADYTDRLTEVFAKHGTEGTWYAHASVGTLHVRPILNMKTQASADTMRAIAEEAFAFVRDYKGSHSGEHGDGIVRSEFHEEMFGSRLVGAFGEVKDKFDPTSQLNPGKIVRPYRQDDRDLFRFKPGYAIDMPEPALDWSEWGGFSGAVEMCNNNGACRKAFDGVMCPSFRVTGEEQHLTRGRANTLRQAISGQLGPDAFTSDEMKATLDLCVSCKGCKRECPTGVDMARMKIEFRHHHAAKHGLRLRERLVAWLPRYAPYAARLAPLFNLRNTVPGLAALTEKLIGFDAKRPLPTWRADAFRDDEAHGSGDVGDVVLWADSFNRWFEPENLRAAVTVLEAAGYSVRIAGPVDAGRPLCCGRTFLAAGLIAQARHEMQRSLDALMVHVDAGRTIVGLEPSCLFTFRDELAVVLPSTEANRLASQTLLFEEFLVREKAAGRLSLDLKPLRASGARWHGHCHQKAFGATAAVQQTLDLVPDLDASLIDSSCCGMAGAFGYEAEHAEMSMKMAELDLLPAVRDTDDDTLLIADGFSCRHQIADGTGRQALHVARILEKALSDETRA
jgi:FAD/FMN-containing dehydrogenase/Fe-S oxidoreductase